MRFRCLVRVRLQCVDVSQMNVRAGPVRGFGARATRPTPVDPAQHAIVADRTRNTIACPFANAVQPAARPERQEGIRLPSLGCDATGDPNAVVAADGFEPPTKRL